MHFRPHVSDEMQQTAKDIAGRNLDECAAGMIEHDMHVSQLLGKLDEKLSQPPTLQ